MARLHHGADKMSEEYNNQKTEQSIGQLYPVLVSKDGKVIDGFHRLKQNPEWRKEKLEQIDNGEKLLVARAVANWNRRQVSREEKAEWINGLAEIYKQQGYKVGTKGEKNDIVNKIVEVTGISQPTVNKHLSSEYQQRFPPQLVPKQPESALDRLKSDRVSVESRYGEDFVERLQNEVKEETKRELLKSPTFQREVIKEIQKPRIIHPSEACPSGICELPPTIEAGEPIDIIAESLTIFWENNPNCHCQTCDHYKTCGAIR